MYLTEVVYEHEGFTSVLVNIFGNIWNGLTEINIPGTNWPIAGFFIAIFTAGLILKLLKHLFADVLGNTKTGFDSDHGRNESRRR